MEALVGSSVFTKNGGNVSLAEALGDAEYVMVYFSAHWCP
jgi:hypothetical protein